MFKKVAALLLGITLIFSMMLPAFASNSDQAFEVVEPTFGKNNEVITKNLLINIRIYEEIPLEMTLVRVEPNISNAVVREEISSLEDTSAHMMPVLVADDVNEVDLSTVEAAYEVQSSYSEDERREIAEAYLQMLIDKQNAEEEFIRAFKQYKELFYSDEMETFVELTNLSYYELEVVSGYKKALETMMVMNKQYELLKPVYESIFESVVLGPEEVALDGVIPFYRTVVEDIKPGDYKLVFSSEGDVISTREFTVKELLEEKIKAGTTEILNNVINESEIEK